MGLSIMMCYVIAFSRVSLEYNASIPAFSRLAVLGPRLVHAYYRASQKETFPVQNEFFYEPFAHQKELCIEIPFLVSD